MLKHCKSENCSVGDTSLWVNILINVALDIKCSVPPLVLSGRSTRHQETHTCTGKDKKHVDLNIASV